MSVVRETVIGPRVTRKPKVRVLKAARQANGIWYVEFTLDCAVAVGDGRTVRVRRTVSLGAEPQIGRRPKTPSRRGRG